MYVATEGPLDAKIMLVGESPGSEEDASGKPFQGYAGRTLNTLLGQAGIARYQCLVTNVARERPPANRISFFFEDKQCTIPKPKLAVWIETLRREIALYKPNIIIALGSTALWALTGEKKISEFRGYILPCSLVPGIKVLATYHPQAINYDWKLYFPCVLDLRKGLRHSSFKDFPVDNRILLPDRPIREFVAYMEKLIHDPTLPRVSIDIETDPKHPGSHITELGIGHSPDFAMSILPVKGGVTVLCENDELLLWQTFARLVSCKQAIMQNAAYDCGVLWHNQHILVENLWMDTLIAAHIVWPELPRDLGFLGSVCLDIPPWKGSSKNGEYNPSDVANTFGIAEVLNKEIDKQNIRSTFNFEMEMIKIALMMQLQGVEVDRDKQKELVEKWSARAKELKTALDKILSKPVNFSSPKQMQELLYVDLGLPIQYKRRKSINDPRTVTTDANALKTLSRLVPDNPVFNLILEYKKSNTLVKNFLDIELSPTGRVHTSYNITGASSDIEEDTKKSKRSFGRWSSSASIILPYGSGNLQNIPAEARKMYRARPGWKIVQADYIQAEGVVVAYLSGNQKLKRLFQDSFGLAKSERAAYDIHIMKASEVFGIPYDQVTPEQRRVGKTLRHARNYSAGPQVLANALGVSISRAKQLIELDKRLDPMLEMWHLSIQNELKKTRTLYNLFGRKHRFLDRWGDGLFRSAYSFIPQGTVGDLLNKALLQWYEIIPTLPYEVIPIFQLHDAMYNLIREEHINATLPALRKAMLIPLRYNNEEFTIDVDFAVGDSWGETKEIDINWRGTI